MSIFDKLSRCVSTPPDLHMSRETFARYRYSEASDDDSSVVLIDAPPTTRGRDGGDADASQTRSLSSTDAFAAAAPRDPSPRDAFAAASSRAPDRASDPRKPAPGALSPPARPRYADERLKNQTREYRLFPPDSPVGTFAARILRRRVAATPRLRR